MILLYHKVDLERKSPWYVTADTFDRQMASLRAFDVVPLDAYDPHDPRQAVITFDGIYENVWRFAAPILEKWGYPYELFVIGDHIGGDNGFDRTEPPERFATIEMLSDMSGRGARIQWHSASHRRMDGLADAELAQELTVPAALHAAFGEPHWRWFAYPHDAGPDGGLADRVGAAVRDRFAGALAVAEGSSGDRYRLERRIVAEDTRLPGSRVSIIIANYNYGRFLAEAIDSVLHQTHAPDEILVIDDASTDDSAAILASFAEKVQVEINDRNLGIIENFSKAVSLTTGDFVGFLGADNLMRSDYVERTRAALDANPQAAVAYTDMAIFGPLAELLALKAGADPTTVPGIYHWRFPAPAPDVVANIANRNFIHGSSLYRRHWYDRVGGYRMSERAEDHHLFTRMLEAGGGAVHVPHCLIGYRQHAMEQANTVRGLQLRIASLERNNRALREKLAQAGVLPTTARQIFEPDKPATNIVPRPSTHLQWTEEGLEIEGMDADPGFTIDLTHNRSKRLGLRVVMRADAAGLAQLYSLTIDEQAFEREFQILMSIRRGWNFLTFVVSRDSPIRMLRFDPSDRAGRFLVQELAIFPS